jgi:curved DNA-binding protein CbpA
MPVVPPSPTRREEINAARADLRLIGEITPQSVRAAYLSLVKTWHPDLFGDDPELRASAEEHLKRINVAYALLREVARERPLDPLYRAVRERTEARRSPVPRPPARPLRDGQPNYWLVVALPLLALAFLASQGPQSPASQAIARANTAVNSFFFGALSASDGF